MTRTTAFGPAVTAGIPTRTFPARAEGGVGGSAALLIAPAQFLLCEVVAAAAWRRPGYSYFRNFISDLGVTDGPMTYQGRLVDSPLRVLMNVSFFLLGIIGAYGIIMLTRSLPPSRHRGWLRLAGVAFGLGGILVGLFPENTIELAHAAGAFLNIGFGNVVLILVGARATRYYAAPPWVAWLLVGLGTMGSAAMVVLVTVPALFTGAVERTAAYPYMVSLIVLGAAGLIRTHATVPIPASRRKA